jgi:hypothetical protein
MICCSKTFLCLQVYLEYTSISDTVTSLASQGFLQSLIGLGSFPLYGMSLSAVGGGCTSLLKIIIMYAAEKQCVLHPVGQPIKAAIAVQNLHTTVAHCRSITCLPAFMVQPVSWYNLF